MDVETNNAHEDLPGPTWVDDSLLCLEDDFVYNFAFFLGGWTESVLQLVTGGVIIMECGVYKQPP